MKEINVKEMNKSVAVLFKATRKFHRFQQTEFSAILGVTQGTISKIESATMNPDLGLWFRFLRAFNIQDPYCFTYDGIEFADKAFGNLKNEGSVLAPEFDFSKDDHIFNVRKIRPLYDFLLKNHSKALETFLKSHKISRELFYILNHPLGTDFVDTFFTFLDESKINSKSVMLLNLNFDAAFGRQKESLGSLDLEEVFTLLNNDEGNVFCYEYSEKKGEYFINKKRSESKLICSLKKSDFIINYDLLYPYHLMKSMKNIHSTTPLIHEIKKCERWQVLYA